jgi:hypothetical protein
LLAHYYFDSQLWRTPKQHFSLHKILTTMWPAAAHCEQSKFSQL